MAAAVECKTCDYMVQATKVAFQNAWERNGIKSVVQQIGLEFVNAQTRFEEIVNPSGAAFKVAAEFRTDMATGQQQLFWVGYEHPIAQSMQNALDDRVTNGFSPEQIASLEYQRKLFLQYQDLVTGLQDGEGIQFIVPRDADPKNGVSFGQIVNRGGKYEFDFQLTPFTSISEIQAFQAQIGQGRETIDLSSISTNDVNPVFQWLNKGLAVDIKSELPQLIKQSVTQEQNLPISPILVRQGEFFDRRFNTPIHSGVMTDFSQKLPTVERRQGFFPLNNTNETVSQFTEVAPLFAMTMVGVGTIEGILQNTDSELVMVGMQTSKNESADFLAVDYPKAEKGIEPIVVETANNREISETDEKTRFRKQETIVFTVAKESIVVKVGQKRHEVRNNLTEGRNGKKPINLTGNLHGVAKHHAEDKSWFPDEAILFTEEKLRVQFIPAAERQKTQAPMVTAEASTDKVDKVSHKSEEKTETAVLKAVGDEIKTRVKKTKSNKEGVSRVKKTEVKKPEAKKVKPEAQKAKPTVLFLPPEVVWVLRMFGQKRIIKNPVGAVFDRFQETTYHEKHSGVQSFRVNIQEIYPRKVETGNPTQNSAAKLPILKPNLAFLALLLILKIKFQLLKLTSQTNLAKLFTTDTLLLFMLKPELFLLPKKARLSTVFDPVTINHTIGAKT